MSVTADHVAAQSLSPSHSGSPSPSRDAATLGSDDLSDPFNPAAALKRHEHFWFEDGNIVLVAQQTAFKVYRGLLVAQSTVFSDMFQASCRDESEIFADSPMIHLNDSPHDLAHFLEALMQLNERHLYHKEPPLLDFERLFAVVQLAHKYGVDDIMHQGIEVLTRYYDDAAYNELNKTPDKPHNPLADSADVHAIGAIHLARLTGTPSIVPAAMLICCKIPRTVISGWKRDDGSVVRLSEADLVQWIVGRETLAKRAVSDYLKVLTCVPSTDCKTPKECRERIMDAMITLNQSSNATLGDSRIMMDLFTLADAICKKIDQQCWPCRGHVGKVEEERWKQVWKDLPEIFECLTPRSSSFRPGHLGSGSGAGSTRVAHSPLSASVMTSTGLVLERHQSFWFDDGNVVLVAQQTAFKVYRGLLAAQSSVFSDKFQVSGGDERETLDGSPVIRISDSSHDVARFLGDIIPLKGRHLSRKNQPPLDFEHVFATVKLAHKYGVRDIEQQGIAALEAYYLAMEAVHNKPQHIFMDLEDVHAIGAIHLARLTDTPSIIPTAMLICCGIVKRALSGWKRHDGSVVTLSEDDLTRFIVGHDTLARRTISEYLEIFTRVSGLGWKSQCTSTDRCKKVVVDNVTSLRRSSDAKLQESRLILFNMHEITNSIADALYGCNPCRGDIGNFGKQGQRGVWQDLPKIFDIVVERWPSRLSDSPWW